MKNGNLSRQEKRVFEYIVNHGSITSLDAIQALGVTRLAAVIFNLKGKGYRIKTETVSVKNRHKEDCSVARYELEAESTGQKKFF